MASELGVILEFIGEKNTEKVKEAVTVALIDNLVESINKDWVIVPDEIYDMWHDLLTKCFEKHSDKIEIALSKQFDTFYKSMMLKEFNYEDASKEVSEL